MTYDQRRLEMSQITVDAALRDKLLGAQAETELRDDQGRLLGKFVPAPELAFFDIPGLDLPAEEVRRRLSPDAKTSSPEEVMARLRSLT
jgi:hypothetical protein